MIIGPKYKIARRLDAPVFEKTQGPKYAISLARKSKKGSGRRPGQRSVFGEQLIEKQKARFTYLLTEKQFSNYVRKAIAAKGRTIPTLMGLLEGRLDNVIYRIGLATTRSGARQMVSHGHITVNGRRVDIPSYQVREGDVLGVREGSLKKTLFSGAEDRLKGVTSPVWVKVDPAALKATVTGSPANAGKIDTIFDLNAVIEFYSR